MGVDVDWIIIVIASAAVMGLVSISDKAEHRFGTSPSTVPLMMGIIQIPSGIIILTVFGIPSGIDYLLIVFAFLSGLLFAMGAILWQRILFTHEVSRTIPITQSAPIFAALLALTVLDESISFLQWLGIVSTVVGCMLLSIKIKQGVRSVFLGRSFYVLMFAALLVGGSNVVGKMALDGLPVLVTHGVRVLTLGLFFTLVSFRASAWSDVKRYFSERSQVLLLVGLNEVITANVGGVLLLWALSLGPVSLVTALSGTRALFVVIYGLCLAVFMKGALGEETTPGIILLKVFSAVLIVVGIAAISV